MTDFALMENDQLIEAHSQIHSLAEGSDIEACAKIRQEHDLIGAELVRRGIPHETGIVCPESEIVTDAPGYIRSFQEVNCSNCVFGQVAQWCSLYNFEYVPNYVCDSWQTIQVIELEKPHGYLVWKGKQTAIASDKIISDSESFLVTSSDEAFGIVTLDKPAQMNTKEFNRVEWMEKHRIYPHEQRQFWPDAKFLYVHKIADFEPFEKAQLFADGKIIVDETTKEQKKLLDKSKRLPKNISLVEGAVSLIDGNTFNIHEVVKGNKELEVALKAVYEMEVQQAKSGNEVIPLYSLSLVRNPKMRVSKKNSTGDDMVEETSRELATRLLQSLDKDEKQEELPFVIVESEGRQCVVRVEDDSTMMCYEGETALVRAEALLNMLNMPEAEVEIEEEEEAYLDDLDDDDEDKQFTDTPWDGSASRWDTADAYCEDTLIDVNPSGEDKIKGLCKLPFRDPGTTNPNINAIRAIAGGNGITATEKPASVSQEEWDSQTESAANRVIGWYPEAFDTEAPEGVFRIAGKERPEEKESDKQQSLTQRVNFIEKQFNDMFGDQEDWTGPWAKDIFDTHIIADDDGKLFRVNFVEDESSTVFVPREQWVEVEVDYTDKAATLLWSKPKEKVVQHSGNGLLAKAKNAMTALGDFLAGVESEKPSEDIEMFSTPSGFAVKMVDGKPYHFAWTTNAFEDREGEIFSTKALEQYVLENEKKEHRGYFNLWHINEDNSGLNSDFAEKKWQGVSGRFLVEFGPYLDDRKGQSALRFFKKYPDGHPEFAPEGWGCSPEFKFLPEERETGVFDWLFITKTSILPRAAAANIWTGAEQKENVMTITKDQEKLYIEALGEEDFEKMVKEGENKTRELEAGNIAHKKNELKTEVDIKEFITNQLPTLEEIAQEIGKQFSEDREPLMKVIASLENGMKELQDKFVQVEKHIEVKQAVETPRYILGMQRASESAETVVEDDLKDKKPEEVEAKNSDSASHFFGSK